MKKVKIYFSLLFSMFCLLGLNAQEKVGVNTSTPVGELDVRTTSAEDGADINIGNVDNSHFLRLFSGKVDQAFSNPTLYWNHQDSLVFGTFGSQFLELARLNSDGDFLLKEGGIAMGLDSTDGFFEILVDSSFVEDQIDQSSSGSATNITLVSGIAIGQSFTVGSQGFLKSISIPTVFKSTGQNTEIRLNLYQGNNPNGTLLSTVTAIVHCEDFITCSTVPIVTFKIFNVAVQPGEEYFIEIQKEVGADIIFPVIQNGNYGGGTSWTFLNNTWRQEPIWDIPFESIVGVPSSTLVPFFKITNEGSNSRVQIKNYSFPPNHTGNIGQVMVTSSSGQLEWQNKADSDWDVFANSVYTINRNVGIGQNAPDTKLHIISNDENDGSTGAIKIETPGTGGNPDQLMFIDGNEIDAFAGDANGDNDMLMLQNNSQGDVNMVIGGGHVGIGKENAGNTKLLIHQNTSFEPNLTLSKLGSMLNLDNNSIWAEDELGGYEPLDIQQYGALILSRHNGVVGVGTSNVPDGYKLAVHGKIVTEEVLVQNFADWPDYVFKEDYDLMNLKELKQYIETHKHLPNVPSETEVYAKGIELGEMQKTLMEKIEELTLYILQQEDRIQKLELQLQTK